MSHDVDDQPLPLVRNRRDSSRNPDLPHLRACTFIEGFLVSLKPLSQLFSSPYRFIPENGSFEAYRTMWVSVPGFAWYIFNSFLISGIITIVVLIFHACRLRFRPLRVQGRVCFSAAFLRSRCSPVPCC